MTAVAICPIFNGEQFFDNSGLPLSGGKIFTYVAGSNTTLQTSYSDSAGTTANANPMILNSSGRMPQALWLDATKTYNLVLTLPDGTTSVFAMDNVVGTIGQQSTAAASTAVWTSYGAATYVSPTQFLVAGNATTQFAIGNRVQALVSGNFVYGSVSAVAFSTPNTQVTIIADSTALGAGLSAVYYSVMQPSNKPIDAVAVVYNSAITAASNTVGGFLTSLKASQTADELMIANMNLVYGAGGSQPNYTLTVTPAVTSLALFQVYQVKFNATATGSPTLNVNAIGAANVMQYTASGALVPAVIINGMVSTVLYDGTQFILVDQLPITATPFSYALANSTGTAVNRTVFLTIGTWQLSLDTRIWISDGTVSGSYNQTMTQVATCGSTTVTTSIALQHTGGSGYGRNQHGSNIAVGNLVVSAAGNFTLAIAALAPGTPPVTSSGSRVFLEKIA